MSACTTSSGEFKKGQFLKDENEKRKRRIKSSQQQRAELQQYPEILFGLTSITHSDGKSYFKGIVGMFCKFKTLKQAKT